MKKFFIIFLLLFLNILNVNAYENEYFKIDIPESYKLEKEDEYTYKWVNNNKYISITISDNLSLNYDIKSYSDEDISNQKTYIEENINKGLQAYNIKVNVTDIKKIVLDNDTYALNYKIYWPSKEKLGYDIYQVGNVISSEKYITTVIYSSDNEIDYDEYNSIIDSFVIKDKLKRKSKGSIIVILLCLICAFLGVFNAIKRQKRTRK
jgi:hypothetical protein